MRETFSASTISSIFFFQILGYRSDNPFFKKRAYEFSRVSSFSMLRPFRFALRIDESFPRAVGINERDVTILSYTFNFQLSIIVCSYLPFVSYPYPYRSVTVNSFFLLTYYRSVISSPCIILLLDICLRSLPYVILPLVYPSNVYVIVYRRNI